MKKNVTGRAFWIVQVLGWTMYSLSSFVTTFDISLRYKSYAFVATMIIGISVTSVLRYYLKQYSILDNFNGKALRKTAMAVLLSCIAYFLLAYPISYIYELFYEYTPGEKEMIDTLDNPILMMISSSIAIFLWLALYYTIKIFIRKNKNKLEQMELNTTLKEAQLNVLKGQVNPHFMFNSLNNIRGLMLEDVDKSQEMISKLSEMLQYALAKNTVDAIPLEEEMEMVENYIALSKIQMEDRLHYVEEIAPETLQTPIPPMIIQLLVENAAKHGIANLKDGGTISVKTKKEDQDLFITVTNTGKLRIAKGSTQLGLKNIRQRLRLLHGQKATFSLEEKEGAVIANIKIPLS